MVKIIRSPARLYRSPDIKSNKKKRSRVFDVIPILDDEKKHTELNIFDQRWEMQFYELQKFKKKYGHCDVAEGFANGKYNVLARWCHNQRRERKHNSLKYLPYRLQKLNELDFCWEIKDKWFESKLHELKQYREKYGHCDVPKTSRNNKYYALARWCNTQRTRKKYYPGKYSLERLKKLNEIGFSWDVNDKRFESKFQLLEKYYEKHGNCNVSRKQNPVLAEWCEGMRYLYKRKKSTLTKERLKRLDELGFSWESSKERENEIRWEYQFARLKNYKEEYGHCNIGQSEQETTKYRYLAAWARVQRKHYFTKNKCLTADKIKKLNSIGFNWVNPLKVGAKRIDDKALLAELRRLYIIRGTPPSAEFIDKHGKYSAYSYVSHFGGMAKARKAAGIILTKISRQVYSDNELIDELKRVATLLGKTPKHDDVLKHGKYSPKLYFKRFGGLRKARQKAGLNSSFIPRSKIYSDLELLEELKRLTTLLGKKPSGMDVIKHGKYSLDTYYSHFGSFIQAREMAGLNVEKIS